ncbi:agmatine deiminase family protein [Aliikangiella maris]|uniref:Agmatine deiminase family protein n=2 Tax=Aliikangiella maris TaxID=3162458 RepID=A0ABV3MPA9_9GAMM
MSCMTINETTAIQANQTGGVHWPAEWEPHTCSWMMFPCRTAIWSHGLETAHKVFSQVANQISEYEPVKMLILPEHLAKAKKYLSSAIELINCSLDDSWARDTSPIWVTQNNQLIAKDFLFNGWGEQFVPHDKDRKIAQFIAQYEKVTCQSVDMVLEGGAVHSNGNGLLLTTKECLLHPNRNPTLSQQDIEQQLKLELGVEQIIWLERGIVGDVDTNGHVDNIACFVNPSTILTQKTLVLGENTEIYHLNKQVINEHGLSLVEIPEPEAKYQSGERIPLSYINFYIINNAVIMPAFGCKQDDSAYQMMVDLFPERKIHMIDANEILVGGGGIHCITMQQPVAPGNC